MSTLREAVTLTDDEAYARHVTKRLELYAVLQEIVADAIEHDLGPEAVGALWSFGLVNYEPRDPNGD